MHSPKVISRWLGRQSPLRESRGLEVKGSSTPFFELAIISRVPRGLGAIHPPREDSGRDRFSPNLNENDSTRTTRETFAAWSMRIRLIALVAFAQKRAGLREAPPMPFAGKTLAAFEG